MAETSTEDKKAPSSDITIDDLINANTYDALMDKYDNICTTGDIDGQKTVVYCSKDHIYGDLGESQEEGANIAYMRDDKDSFVWTMVQGEPLLVYQWYPGFDEDGEGALPPISEAQPVIDPVYTALEKITNVEDHGDGTMTITTIVDPDTLSRQVDDDEMIDEEIREKIKGTSRQQIYEVDSDTLVINHMKESYLDEKGNAVIEQSFETEKNVTPPEGLTEMISQADDLFYDAPSDPKTITVIYDPGTDEEKTYRLKVDKKLRVLTFPKEGYELYEDPDKKEIAKDSDGKSDRTMYAFKMK
jgi:hypothetical protein